ncbi:tyrosine-type recombinase/integrase [Candidatus Venteria ishoeyi]|uniref:Putative prophage CPS-53 integrase n=1 Tax=Candidatus Venteria ishoeyi TaxID=1899563 RepID=A0A1H6FCE3_9GAMM|nr:integrase arm-type DNA-binding domain-containing protein [Candidatus Venteria ishoeyi]SEH06685.1 Putative prophage CPS-53 integrase [Candidatus Venteria ishoeyi]
MSLTDIQIRNVKPKDKPYKLSDGKGLYLLINKAGKYWRYGYRFSGKQKTLALGVYPETTLQQARLKLADARLLLADGVDPSTYKQAQKQANKLDAENSLEMVARDWFGRTQSKWTKGYADATIKRLEKDIFPWLGNKPITDIKPPDVLRVLRRIESRGANETAHRMLQICGMFFRYAVATGVLESDPCRDLRGALAPVKRKHHPSITDPANIAPLMQVIRDYEGELVTRCALKLLPLVFVRPGELRQAEWSEIDLGEALWSIPASKMKMKADHLIPLSSQAVEILREIQPLTQQTSRYVFPSIRSNSRPMSENTINAALRRLGYTKEQMTGHGFRAMARTNLDEILRFRIEVIEMQLAHAVRDANGRAYNRTQYIDDRQRMMQAWADWLDDLQVGDGINGNNIVPINKAG